MGFPWFVAENHLRQRETHVLKWIEMGSKLWVWWWWWWWWFEEQRRVYIEREEVVVMKKKKKTEMGVDDQGF